MFTHGNRNGETIGEMLGENFYYGALDSSRVRELLAENGFEILTFTENLLRTHHRHPRSPRHGKENEMIVTIVKPAHINDGGLNNG